MWKWIHTSSCPEIEEYGGHNSLSKYCLRCLRSVWYASSSDWYIFSRVERKIKSENCKMRSLKQYCMKQIIEKNIPCTHLPDIIKNQIQELKDQ